MRRILSHVLIIFMALLLSIPCYAIGAEELAVSPRYTYIRDYEVSLTIDEDTGAAEYYANCVTLDEQTVVQVVCKLQKYTGAYWTTLKTWYASGTPYARVSGEWPVENGYTYRVYVTISVCNSEGDLLESDTIIRSYVYPTQ